MLSKHYESTEVDHRLGFMCPGGLTGPPAVTLYQNHGMLRVCVTYTSLQMLYLSIDKDTYQLHHVHYTQASVHVMQMQAIYDIEYNTINSLNRECNIVW